ncbi:Zn(II)2Cys6 transcription factor domain-containing protein [Aspergillus undulatus]|uniref:Zn(II)2Cys6 transcription factor domain-containing protein n=1 Tax=Aspergillus undulatus TaxID=1810928 RepID=UPI003CCD48C1
MASLRKACRNCTASKRKCVVQLPKCTRCAQRGLECMYDLEPLGLPAAQPKMSSNHEWNPAFYNSPGYCLLKNVETRPSYIDPAVCEPGHEGTLELVRLGYQSVPDLVKSGKPATFVHPKLHLHGDYNHFDDVMETRNGVNYESFRRLIELDLNVIPIKEALTALQALLIYLSTSLLDNMPMNVEKCQDLLVNWAQALLASAQARSPPNQSPWQTWLFGESVRRTIIMSYGLAMSLSSFKQGYCSYWIFLESLPFDRRAGLWMAGSPQAWIAAAGAKSGQEVEEQLISFHEFAENVSGLKDFRGDSFLELVAFAHNGVE